MIVTGRPLLRPSQTSSKTMPSHTIESNAMCKNTTIQWSLIDGAEKYPHSRRMTIKIAFILGFNNKDNNWATCSSISCLFLIEKVHFLLEQLILVNSYQLMCVARLGCKDNAKRKANWERSLFVATREQKLLLTIWPLFLTKCSE